MNILGYVLASGATPTLGSTVVTDNWPVDFRYISRRLVREIVQQHEAAGPGREYKIGGTAGITAGPVNFGLTVEESKRPVDDQNYYDLARRATMAVIDHTGYLDKNDPHGRIPTGPYVRARMHLQMQQVPLGAWEDAYNHPIAAFVGYETLDDFGRVFVGLVGSASNFVHSRRDQSRATRTPSDALGLYEIIEQCRELTADGVLEPGISARHLARERIHCSTDLARYHAAASLFQGTYITAYSEQLEALIRVHHLATDIDLDITGPDGRRMRPFDLVILGAPIWVSTPEPRRDDALLDPRQAADQLSAARSYRVARTARLTPVPGFDPSDLRSLHTFGATAAVRHDVTSVTLSHVPASKRTPHWALYDSHLDAYLEASSQGLRAVVISQWPPSGSLWQEFGEWFVDQAYRLGPDPLPFGIPARRWQFAFLRFGWSKESLEPSGEFGWFAPNQSRSERRPFGGNGGGVIVLTDGSIWPAFENGIYRGMNKPRPLGSDTSHERAANAILRMAAQWRTPLLYPDHLVPVEIISPMSQPADLKD